MAKRWARHTPAGAARRAKGKRLPPRKRKRRGKKPPARNFSEASINSLTVNAERRKRASPLKLDPTRTVTLRRAFAARLKRQFRRLKFAVHQLVVRDDAFGLKERRFGVFNEGSCFSWCERPKTVGPAANVFCAAGEGGGIDPSCSPSGGGDPVGIGDAFAGMVEDGGDAEAAADDAKDKFREALERWVERAVKDAVDDYGQDAEDSDQDLLEEAASKLMRSFEETVDDWQDWEDDPAALRERLRLVTGDVERMMGRARDAYIESIELTDNVFCATGEGGGVDPSCSPSGEGRSIASRIKDKVKSKIDKLTQRYGKKGAVAIVVAAAALAAVPVPGTSLLPLAVAEGVRFVARQLTGNEGEDHGLTDAEVEAAARELLEELRGELTENVFCPTGEGGGVDPTCSPGQLVKNSLVEELRRELEPAVNADREWAFMPDPDKVRAFEAWLERKLAEEVRSREADDLWRAYAEEGFRKGAGRAFDDTTKARRFRAGEGDFTAESKRQFLRSSFGRPVAIAKVKLLAGRTFDEMKGLTAETTRRMTRALTDGLVQGKGALALAKDLEDQVDFFESRALMTARTEIIRAHAEGQLQALEDLGVEEVGVAVEWAVTEDEALCPLCAEMEGVVLKMDEARGMIPRHPNCRCAWLPANVDENEKGQTRSQAGVKAAVKESLKKEGKLFDSEWGPA